MVTIESSANTAVSLLKFDANWLPSRAKAYRCHICLIREEDGTFSAVVLNLPGAGSTAPLRRRLCNVREAVLGVAESHAEAGEEIPWQDSLSCEIPENAAQKWILVNA